MKAKMLIAMGFAIAVYTLVLMVGFSDFSHEARDKVTAMAEAGEIDARAATLIEREVITPFHAAGKDKFVQLLALAFANAFAVVWLARRIRPEEAESPESSVTPA